MMYEESKNWKAPPMTWPAGAGLCEKDTGTTNPSDQHPPKKVTLAPEKSAIDARISGSIQDQPFDGAVKEVDHAAY